MTAQSFKNPLFASFEIADAETMLLHTVWGAKTTTIKATNKETRQLATLFYEFGTGQTFFETCLFIAEQGATIDAFDIVELAPKEYDLPKISDQTDFEAWANALSESLGENHDKFFAGMDAYFATQFDGKTLFERTAKGYPANLQGQFLTDGTNYVVVLEQHGQTIFFFDGKQEPAALETEGLKVVQPSALPKRQLDRLKKGMEKFEADTAELKADFLEATEKEGKRAEKAAEKEAAKLAKAENNAKAKETKATEKANQEAAAKAKSAELLEKALTFDDHKQMQQWLVVEGNQKLMDAQTDRKEAINHYKELKTKFELAQKEAEKAEKQAAKEAEQSAKTAAKIEAMDASDEAQGEAGQPTNKGKAKKATKPAENGENA